MARSKLVWQLLPSYLVITLVALGAVTLYALTTVRRGHMTELVSDLEARARSSEAPPLRQQ